MFSVSIGPDPMAEEALLCMDTSSEDQATSLCLSHYRAEVKKRKEVNFHQLSRQDHSRFGLAMQSEWEKILQPHAAQLMPLQESEGFQDCAGIPLHANVSFRPGGFS
eukprot:117735-Amphidinium_carterae.3